MPDPTCAQWCPTCHAVADLPVDHKRCPTCGSQTYYYNRSLTGGPGSPG